MRQILLLGGPFERGVRATLPAFASEVVVPQERGSARYFYVGNLEDSSGQSVCVYRHESISASEIAACVQLSFDDELVLAEFSGSSSGNR